MRIDSAGYPFIVGAFAAAALAGFALGWLFAVPLVVLASFFLFFFRDPERQVAAADDAVVSPADGRVLVAGLAEAAATPPATGGTRSAVAGSTIAAMPRPITTWLASAAAAARS